MKLFPKRCYWGLLFAIGLIGFFLILNFILLQESTVIQKANAQNLRNNRENIEVPRRQADYFPSDLRETITTCGGGCTETASTCEWDCGATFSLCGTRSGQGSIFGLLGGSYTFVTCPTSTTCGNSLFGSCNVGSHTFGVFIGTQIPTSNTCSGGIFCNGGGNTTFMTCGNSPFSSCGIIGGYIGGYTSSTCNVDCGYIIPTSKTCGCKPEIKSIGGETNNYCFILTSAYTCEGYCALPLSKILGDYSGMTGYSNMSYSPVSATPAF